MRLTTNHKRTRNDVAQEDKKGVEILFGYFNINGISMSLFEELIRKLMEIQYLTIGKSDWDENFCV